MFCDKNKYVVEALLANPHKYDESVKEPLRKHVTQCEVCKDSMNAPRI